ncbi:hypothetical protein N7G274_003774 [Stereocaulon virgatum]|uniref:Uncharacterized protein n=1 Tax=Stereocaulon virgatum TaxID=373712 RepID=A0ABR4AC98_9LECA
MYTAGLALLALVAPSIAWTIPKYVEERHVVEIHKRQADIPQLLQLASLAGITAFPTDPAILFALGPQVNSLAAALPTSSVLAVLLTAAPSGFVSQVVNDPSYAASFESAFSAGSSPSWFNGLPTDVRSYLHTYSGFGGLATAAGAFEAATQTASSELIAGGTATGIRPLGVPTTSGSSGASAATATATSGSSGMSMTTSMNSSASAASVSSASTLSAAQNSVTQVSSSRTTASSASSQGGAARPTGAIAVGLAGAIGVLGVAIAL